eukprot:1148771-Pelagomonas_calceolata.AAC.6
MHEQHNSCRCYSCFDYTNALADMVVSGGYTLATLLIALSFLVREADAQWEIADFAHSNNVQFFRVDLVLACQKLVYARRANSPDFSLLSFQVGYMGVPYQVREAYARGACANETEHHDLQ